MSMSMADQWTDQENYRNCVSVLELVLTARNTFRVAMGWYGGCRYKG